MTRQTMNFTDVLSPSGNPWLEDLSRQRGELPVGVRIVRFRDNVEDGQDSTPKDKRRKA